MSDPNVLMGVLAARDGDYERAANSMAAAVQTNPENEEAWQLFGDYLSDPEKRRFCYQRVLELNPANEQARNKLASLEAPSTPVIPGLPGTQPGSEQKSSTAQAPILVLDETQAEATHKQALSEAPTLVLTEPQAEPIYEHAAEPALTATLVSARREQEPAREPEPAKPASPLSVIPVWREEEPAPEREREAEAAPTLISAPHEQELRVEQEPAAQTLVSAQHEQEPNLEQNIQEPGGNPSQVTVWSDDLPVEPAPARPKTKRTLSPAPKRKKSPLRFLLYIFPLMLLILIGLLIALLLWSGSLPH